jgi:hypothetical protein
MHLGRSHSNSIGTYPLQDRINRINSSVPIADTTIEPKQPSRLE